MHTAPDESCGLNDVGIFLEASLTDGLVPPLPLEVAFCKVTCKTVFSNSMPHQVHHVRQSPYAFVSFALVQDCPQRIQDSHTDHPGMRAGLSLSDVGKTCCLKDGFGVLDSPHVFHVIHVNGLVVPDHVMQLSHSTCVCDSPLQTFDSGTRLNLSSLDVGYACAQCCVYDDPSTSLCLSGSDLGAICTLCNSYVGADLSKVDVEHADHDQAGKVILTMLLHVVAHVLYVWLCVACRINDRVRPSIIQVNIAAYALAINFEWFKGLRLVVCMCALCICFSNPGPCVTKGVASSARICGKRRIKNVSVRPLVNTVVYSVNTFHTVASCAACCLGRLCKLRIRWMYKYVYLYLACCSHPLQHSCQGAHVACSRPHSYQCRAVDALSGYLPDGSYSLPGNVLVALLVHNNSVGLNLSNLSHMYELCIKEGCCKCCCRVNTHMLGFCLFDGAYQFRVGEATHPGPSCAKQFAGFCLYVCNVSHVINNVSLIKNVVCDGMCVTEHSISRGKFPELRRRLGKQYKFDLSELDSEKTHNTGGTGILLKGGQFPRSAKPKCKHLAKIIDKGRVGAYVLRVSQHIFINTYIVYGHTSGEVDDVANGRTDGILSAILKDVSLREDVPWMIVGDLNSSVHRLPSLECALKEGRCYDLGGQASKYGGTDNQATCQATFKAGWTRRDFVIASPKCERLVEHFSIDYDVMLPVHAGICIRFVADPPTDVHTKICLPKSFHDVFLDKCVRVYGATNIHNAEVKRQKVKGKANNIFVCDTKVPMLEKPSGLRSRKHVGLADSVVQALEQDDADELEAAKTRQDDFDAASIIEEQRQLQLASLHKLMDQALEGKADVLDHLLRLNNTDGYMAQFASAMEDAVAKFGDVDGNAYKALLGRSTINTKTTVEKSVAVFNECTDEIEGDLSRVASRHLLQHRRLASIKACVFKLAKTRDPLAIDRLSLQIKRDVDAFTKHNKQEDGYRDLIDHFVDTSVDVSKISIFKVQLHSERALKNFTALNTRQSKRGRQQAKRVGKPTATPPGCLKVFRLHP